MSEIENIIQSTEVGKAKYDETLKELLANKQFLSRIMKRFVSEFATYSLEDIETKYIEAETITISKVGVERNKTNIDGISNEDKSLNEGSISYDIIFQASYPTIQGTHIGLYINIEAQNAYYPGYPLEMRGTYYASRRLSSQLKSINQDTNYGCLQKVYSIWICMGDVPNYETNTATLYHMNKRDIIGTVNRCSDKYDLINVIILRINDKVIAEDEVLRLLQVLCSNLIEKQEKLKVLREQGIRIDDRVEEGVSCMCNLSDLVEARGEARGEVRLKKQMAMEMLQDGMEYEKVAKYAKVSIETIKLWEEEITTAV